MNLQKHNPLISKALRDAAKGKECMSCGINDGTIVACHYTGIGAHRFGRGLGIKGHDFVMADLCISCHSAMEGYINGNDYERAWEMLMLCMLTFIRRYNEDMIKIEHQPDTTNA